VSAHNRQGSVHVAEKRLVTLDRSEIVGGYVIVTPQSTMGYTSVASVSR